MNYIYDILLNFNDYAYDIFEWNKTDKIIHIRKIPLIKLNSNDILNFITHKIQISNDFLQKIQNKTEKYDKKKLQYAFLGTDGKIVIAFCVHKNEMKYSQLLFEEELEVIDFSNSLKVSNIKYDILNQKKINYLETRNQKNMKKFIYNKLKNIKDKDYLKFLYLECFNKKIFNEHDDIYYELEKNFEETYIKLYQLLKNTLIKR